MNAFSLSAALASPAQRCRQGFLGAPSEIHRPLRSTAQGTRYREHNGSVTIPHIPFGSTECRMPKVPQSADIFCESGRPAFRPFGHQPRKTFGASRRNRCHATMPNPALPGLHLFGRQIRFLECAIDSWTEQRSGELSFSLDTRTAEITFQPVAVKSD
jgi:hypothetical protein